MSKMVLRLIGVGQHPKVYKVMDVSVDAEAEADPDYNSDAGHGHEKGCG